MRRSSCIRPGGCCLPAILFFVLCSFADDFRIARFTGDGSIVFTNTFPQGVVTVEKAATPTGPWLPEKQTFSISRSVEINVTLSGPTEFLRSRAADLTGTNGSWLLVSNDIIDLPLFANTLIMQPDPVSPSLVVQFSNATLDLLFSYTDGPDPELQQALVDELNQIIQNGAVYDADLFAGITLSPATQNLLAQNPTGPALIQLNRMLLEDTYPGQIQKKSALGFTNLVHAYGLLTTIAGAGGTTISPNNKWLPSFEGGPATNALLSRPHIAMADRAGNIYIADKEAYAIRKVTLDGTIHTVAGTGTGSYGDTNPSPALSVALNNPNGLWVRDDGTFYILDRDNGLIRKVDTNGVCTLMTDNGGSIPEGRGLWVSRDESVLYFSAGTQLKRWDTTNGLAVMADGFFQLGNLAVDPNGRIAVTDRGANRVFRVDSDGTKTLIAGNGDGFGVGDGQLATNAALAEVRGIWFLSTGAYFLATDSGSQVWYVDTDGIIHLFLNGDSFSHAGDGSWFYDPTTPKVSKVRQITMDYDNNLIITEHDAGYIRKVRFLPLPQ